MKIILIIIFFSNLLFSAPGDLLWRYQTGAYILSSPCVSNGVVYVGSRDYYLYAINCSDGTLKWSYRTGAYILSSPCVSDGVVFVGSVDYNFYAINCSNGTLKWRYQTGSTIISSPCVSDGVVYIGSHDRYLYALETYGYNDFKTNKSASKIPDKQFSISPNPFTVRLSISLPSSGAIYSLTGQLIMNLPKGKHSIDTSKWREGIYMVKSNKMSKRIVKVKD
ncbi:MAG: PQQ-binding-like beta-propeller repeat protein [Candidatus Coatesbacteria bacterium]|nr:PQQ-binding-like beta-propeller repeat protein [Candidatus Coatesbacteria bacterium]